MIHYLKRDQLDILKYDACIEAAYNSRIYAYSWYLDIVADKWDVLVLNDYEAVMPLPFMRLKRNLFIKKIIQPPFCQQLGVFSSLKIQQETFKGFMNSFLSYNPKLYNFNSSNIIDGLILDKTVEKNNYELKLSRSYQETYNNYSKNLKRNIVKAKKNNLKLLNNIEANDFINLKKETKHHNVSQKLFEIMKELIENLCSRNFGELQAVYKGETLVAIAFFMKEPKRLVHLFSASTDLGKQSGAIPFLFDDIIKRNAATNLVFDFEGSMIDGVAKFFKSFGSRLVNYNSYQD